MIPQALLLIKALSKGYTFKNIRWLFRQWNNESAFSQSRLYKEHKNPFGMSAVFVRPTTQSGYTNLNDGNTNGIYTTYNKAIQDRFLWDNFYKISPNSKDYGSEVSERYHPSSKYFEVINNTDDKGFRISSLLLILPLPIIILCLITLKQI
jgi:hypothetical protein